MSRLPEPGSRLGVHVHEWNAQLTSKAEEVGTETVAIAFPSDGSSEFDLPRGIAVDLEWVSPRGLMRAAGRSAGLAAGHERALQIELTSKPQVFQRRDYVRANCAIDIVVTPSDGLTMPVNGSTIDVSGGGLQASLPGLNLEAGDGVRLELDLPEEAPIEADARITRRISGEVFGLAFEQIDPNEQERLIRFVFARLRNAAGKAA